MRSKPLCLVVLIAALACAQDRANLDKCVQSCQQVSSKSQRDITASRPPWTSIPLSEPSPWSVDSVDDSKLVEGSAPTTIYLLVHCAGRRYGL